MAVTLHTTQGGNHNHLYTPYTPNTQNHLYTPTSTNKNENHTHTHTHTPPKTTDSRESWLPPQAAVALQRGACALYNACSERERQWVFSCVTRRLARDVVGSVHRREALLGLQRVYESTYKYAGRV